MKHPMKNCNTQHSSWNWAKAQILILFHFTMARKTLEKFLLTSLISLKVQHLHQGCFIFVTVWSNHIEVSAREVWFFVDQASVCIYVTPMFLIFLTLRKQTVPFHCFEPGMNPVARPNKQMFLKIQELPDERNWRPVQTDISQAFQTILTYICNQPVTRWITKSWHRSCQYFKLCQSGCWFGDVDRLQMGWARTAIFNFCYVNHC